MVFINIALTKKTITKILKADKMNSKISSSILDANNQMIVSDFNNAKVSVYKSDASLYDSLNVDVRRIIRLGGPKIYVELNVSSKSGLPVVGLKVKIFQFQMKIITLSIPRWHIM